MHLFQGLTLVFALLLASCMTAGEPVIQESSTAGIEYGRALYVENCAACHGAGAAGDGVVASILNVDVPDLTLLNERHGDRFPTDLVYRVVDGRLQVAAHGDRSMPVWGTEFWLDDGADEQAEVRTAEKLHALINYLKVQQRRR